MIAAEGGADFRIVKGTHIPSKEEDVTLRGSFRMRAPDGEYVGIYRDQIPIVLDTNHIHLTFLTVARNPFQRKMRPEGR